MAYPNLLLRLPFAEKACHIVDSYSIEYSVVFELIINVFPLLFRKSAFHELCRQADVLPPH
jgi:hypothetical protein